MDILKNAYQKMCTSMQGGWGAMAGALGMTVTALENHVYEKQKQNMSVHLARQLQDLSGTTLFAEAVAKDAGGVFFKLPSLDHIGNDDLLAKFNELYAEIGMLSRQYNEFTEDNKLDPNERRQMTVTKDAIHRKTQELYALIFRLFSQDSGSNG